MKAVLVLLILFTTRVFSQSEKTIEDTYIEVVNDGPSTAPEFVVVTIKDINSGAKKEICTDVTSLFWSLHQELKEPDFKKITKFMLSKASQRCFEFKDTSALKRVNFDGKSIENFDVINSIIEKNHLVDSLTKLMAFRETLSQAGDKFYESRRESLKKITDSVTSKRPFTDEEAKMISNLKDFYYDDYYNDPRYDNDRKISEQGKALIKIWNNKIGKARSRYLDFQTEANRMYNKFFQRYYKIYGIGFCHAAFKYGIITYIGDENPVVGFGHVIGSNI